MMYALWVLAHIVHNIHLVHNTHLVHIVHNTHLVHNVHNTHLVHTVHNIHLVHIVHNTHLVHIVHNTHLVHIVHNTLLVHVVLYLHIVDFIRHVKIVHLQNRRTATSLAVSFHHTIDRSQFSGSRSCALRHYDEKILIESACRLIDTVNTSTPPQSDWSVLVVKFFGSWHFSY